MSNDEAAKEMIRILLIEDNDGDVRLVQEMLKEKATSTSVVPFQFQLISVPRLHAGIQLLLSERFDVILIDLTLPDSEGLTTVQQVCVAASETPIIVLSGSHDELTGTAAVGEGAQDYLLKGHIDSEILTRSIRYSIERKKTDLRLKRMAFSDGLTGVANHAQLVLLFQPLLARAMRYKENLAVLFIDFDHFKSINDSYGHAMGDIVLKKMAECLSSNVRDYDIVARIGGDEFVAILDNCRQPVDVVNRANSLLKSINKPVIINKQKISMQASIGISLFPEHGKELPDLLQKADVAMYQAKTSGRNSVQLFTPEE